MLVFGNGFKLTTKGKQMVSSGASYSFSKIVLGAGTYTSAEDATARTSLKSQKQSFDVSDTVVDGSTVTIAGVITNASLAVGYTITEAGVIAKDSTGTEHLFLIGVATLSDPMPAHNDNIPDVVCDMKIKYTTSNTSKVSLSVPETAFARAIELKDVKSQLAQKANQSTTNNLQSQVNSIVLQGTSGDSTAEMAQARVTNGGTLFPTLKMHLDAIEKDTLKYSDKKYGYKWVRGTIDATTGLTAVNNTRLCTDNFCYAEKDLTINISDGTLYKFGVRKFPNYPSATGSIDNSWIYGELIISAGTWFKINLSKYDGSVLTDTEAFGLLFDAIAISDNNSLTNVIKNAESIPSLNMLKDAMFPYIDRKATWSWVIAYLSGSGEIDKTKKYRITTENIETSDNIYSFSFNIEHYKYWIQFYNEIGAVTETKEFSTYTGISSYIMPKGTKFRITIGRASEKTSEVFTTAKNDLYTSLIVKTDGDLLSIAQSASGLIINSPNANIRAYAHRGLSTYFPENTMIAYREAFKKGFRILETDIKFTSDGVAVLLHDSSINRTARNVDGTTISTITNIADITYDQAQSYDFGIWKGSSFAGEKLPKLEELLLFAKKNNCHIQLDGFDSNKIQAIYDLVSKYGMKNYVCWSSFIKSDLETILTLHKKAYVMYLTSSVFTSDTIDDVATLKTDWNTVSFAPFINRLTDYTIINYAHGKDIKVEPYTVNTSAKIVELANHGIDGIITDSINVAETLAS